LTVSGLDPGFRAGVLSDLDKGHAKLLAVSADNKISANISLEIYGQA
jgi:hypothetical protein